MLLHFSFVLKWAQSNSFADGDPKITAMLMSNDVQQKSKAVEEILSRAGLPESTWSGVTLERPEDDPKMGKAAGLFCQDSKEIWIRTDYKHDLSTIVHEHLHARSPGSEKVKKNPKIEEGSVQYLTEEILIDKGVAPRKTYTEYVDAIRIIRTVIAPRQTDCEFAKKPFDIPLGSRYNELKGMCDDYVSKHPKMRQKVREEISKSIETLKGDVEDDEP